MNKDDLKITREGLEELEARLLKLISAVEDVPEKIDSNLIYI